jgi:hypothetical protein
MSTLSTKEAEDQMKDISEKLVKAKNALSQGEKSMVDLKKLQQTLEPLATMAEAGDFPKNQFAIGLT